jgi:ABC-type multidrug transport system fused ATPase/permease subunit
MNISRTLLNPKKIVLVDEATASIDFQTDAVLQKVIKEHLKDCTIITIAHRIDTIISSDRVLVLDKGEILELDSPSQLLKNSTSIFYKLYKESQNRDSTDLNMLQP